jgi:hypothetical protein
MSQVYQRICNKRGVTTAAAVADRFLLEFVLTSIGNAYVSINACARTATARAGEISHLAEESALPELWNCIGVINVPSRH